MIAVDSSVAVAAFASWHELHDPALRAVERGARLPAQAALETYAVLTRLPAPHRAPASLVLAYLDDRFPEPLLEISAARLRDLLSELGGRDIAGAATYDAVIAATARAHDAELVSCDRRAAPTYERLGVRVAFLG